MSEIPFGDNPYTKKKNSKATAAENAASKETPFPPPPPPKTGVAQKRQVEDIQVEDLSKRQKTTAASSSALVVNTFVELAKENYSTEDIQIMHNRSGPEADEAFRLALGEVFVHGLGRMAAKDKRIAELEKSNKKLKDAAKSFNQLTTDIQNRAEKEVNEAKKESSRLQTLLDEANAALKKKDEDHAAALALVQAQLDSAGSEAEMSAVYSEGFLGYLKSFLAAHNDYDWSLYFAPSTVEYMAKFKVKEAKAIEQARTVHLEKVTAELKHLKEAEERKATQAQNDEDKEGDENSHQLWPMAFVEDQEASTSTQIYPYQVFLSFRGEDTRLTFTSHLYTALKNAGINTFKDDKEMSRGNTIRLELEKGINQSRASIIVFSKDYASSKWCLNELAMILERIRASTHIVLPVFYDVDPTNIRRQSGSIGVAFANYEKEVERESNEERKKELEENIIKWRAALEQAANISGMELKKEANRNEAEFIQKVVNVIRKKLRCKILDVAPYLVGMSSHMRDIDLWIRDAATNSSILVISGMGGIGKTTIAKCVFNENYEKFDGCSFVSDIRERSKQPKGLIDIQRQLLLEICNRKKEEIYNVDQGIYQIRDAISCKRVLLVLDDVDDIDQLNAIFRVQGSFFEGSKIVITTRNENLLRSFGNCKVHKVKSLRNDESFELFSFHAFEQGHPTELYMEQTKKIVNLCEGLPLPLRILGSSLIGKKLDFWVSLSRKLETIPDGKIVEKLKISYDSLPDDDVKNIFLHIACFFSGEDCDLTVEILDACEMHALVGIDYLLDRCLLEIASDKKMMMHQLVRAMGRDIVRKESPDEPGERTRLWHPDDCYNVLCDKTGTKTLKALAFHMKSNRKENSYDPYFDTEAFAKMQKLKFLQLSNVELSGSYGKFPRSLRWLSWHGCHFEYLPDDLSLQRLVCLDMQHSGLMQLWKDSKRLPALKILNLSYSTKLTTSPDFSVLPKLEKIILEGCTELVEICESIISAEGLVLLNVKDCRKLTKLPRSIGSLIYLEILDISGCSDLREFPGGLINLQLLKEFRANDVDMNALLPLAEGIPNWNFFPQFVGTLSLARCNLSNDFFPQDLSNFLSLKSLDLSGNFFTSLRDCFQTLSKLEKLFLNYCPLLQSVTGLPRNFRKILKLEGYAYSLECLECPNLVQVGGCFQKVSIRYVFRRIKRNLGLLELEKRLIELDLYKDIKVTHESRTFSTWVPGDELPGCFTFKKKGITELSFIVPDNVEIQGFTVGFVCSANPLLKYGLVAVTIDNETQGLTRYFYGITRSYTSEVWLIYFNSMGFLEAGDEINASVGVLIGDEIIASFRDVTGDDGTKGILIGDEIRDETGVKEFGYNLVLCGDNDADDEVCDIDFDDDILTSEQNSGDNDADEELYDIDCGDDILALTFVILKG